MALRREMSVRLSPLIESSPTKSQATTGFRFCESGSRRNARDDAKPGHAVNFHLPATVFSQLSTFGARSNESR
jgi:hypothetical protein